MAGTEAKSTQGDGTAIPEDVYASQVSALFSDVQSLAIGSIAATLTAFVTGLATQRAAFHAIAILLLALSWGRLRAIKAFQRIPPDLFSRSRLKLWERIYIAGAGAHVALLGLLCLVAFAQTDDTFARLATFSITMAYLVGIPGRNFASNLLVDALIVCAAVPMFAALAIAGHLYWVIAFIILVPFFLAMRTISGRLRGIFLSAVLRARDIAVLADRFDTALNNMPHGLALLDGASRLLVANARFSELLRVPGRQDLQGLTLEEVLDVASQAGLVGPSDLAALVVDVQRRLERRVPETVDILTLGKRNLTLTLEPMRSGGCVALVEDVTERQAAQARISHLARYDPLTGLPNRAAFGEMMVDELRADEGAPSSAVMFIDLDQFKQVNDTMGHVAGDKLLRAVAGRLQALQGPRDVIARFGGDEFVLFHRSISTREAAARHAETIIATLSAPYEVDEIPLVIGASVGIVMTAERGHDIEVLLRNADMALYRAKAEGRSTWRFFEEKMEQDAKARRNIEFDLRRALGNDELDVYFQPIFNIRQNRICAYEALVRWRHPTLGFIPPSDFVPIAEEIGLIVQMGDWVLHRACSACTQWPEDVHVAVNISPVQFRCGAVTGSVKAALASTGLAARRLEIEITESVLLQNLSKTKDVLNELRAFGVGVSLDDFGTGYSSLSYLHSLPLSKIKIDRSFLHGLESDSRAMVLLRGVTRLSTDLGLCVVVEGVETEEQLRLVATQADVDQIQGYLFGRPAPASEIPRIEHSALRPAA